MWELYKRTFRGMQIAIAMVTIVIFAITRRWFVASVFLCTMQVGAVMGAVWGARLKRMFQGSSGRLPARRA
jgi:hypothetical protein